MKKVSYAKMTSVICIIILMLFLLIFSDNKIYTKNEIETDDWNNGYCIEDGGRLSYVSTGSLVRYKCEICGKEYVFKGVQKYE